MLTDFMILEKARRRLWYNTLFRSGRKSVARLAIIGALGAMTMGAEYLFFRRLLLYFTTLPVNVGEILVIQLLNLMCLTFFSMLVFSNVITSISTLFMSRDLDFLMSSPIPLRDVFLSKYILTMINSSWMAAAFLFPVFVAYGQTSHAPWQYYPAAVPLFIPYVMIPAGGGILITMTLMRFFPARRAYQALSFVGVAFISGLVMMFRFLQPEKFLGKDVPDAQIIGFVERLKAPDYPWLPSSMLARGLQLGSFGDWEGYAVQLGYISAAAALAALLTGSAALAIYYSGWSGAQGSSRLTALPAKERLLYRIMRRLLARASGDTRALAIKDIKLFWRDTGQWSQLLMLGALVVVYIFNIRNLPLDNIYIKSAVAVVNIGLCGVVLASVAVRFVFSTTSVEGGSFWVIKAAPVDFGRFLWEKFLLYLFPLIILAEILVVVSNILLGVDAYVMTVSAGAIFLLTMGLTGLGVGMGAMYPKFDYENIAEVGTTTGAILYMMASMAYAGVTVVICAHPVRMHLLGRFYKKTFWEQLGGVDVWLSYLALIVLTAALILIPMAKGRKALERMEI
jgi:ABC-2 type transport system permease protein